VALNFHIVSVFLNGLIYILFKWCYFYWL